MEKFNLKQLGINYTVLDRDTQQSEMICVINSEELRAVIGEYIGNDYSNTDLHMKELLKGFKGFAPSPYHITWYVAKESDYQLRDAIQAARKEKNTIIITEILPDKELDTGFKRS